MKFTLISPYPDFRAYGIRSISTFLRNNGIDVSTIYLLQPYASPYKEIIFDQLAALISDSDLVGISVMSNYFMNCGQITRELKKRLNISIVWGGVHATVAPEECLEYCDIAVMGEGEQTILEILNASRLNNSSHNIEGTAVKLGGKIYRNKPRPLMPTEDLPIIDNDYSSDYILLKRQEIRKICFKTLKNFITRDYMTLTSFGCPFSCSYCINNKLNKLYGGRIRFRKLDDVINEMVSAKSKMPFIKHITFDDDAFIKRNTEEIKKFAAEYKDKIKLPFFVSGVNPLLVSDEKIKILVDAGMNRIKMGIQSGSKISKTIYNRHITNEKIISSARIINTYKKQMTLTGYDLILDNPFETRKNILETIALLSKLPAPFTLNLTSLTFYPGTDIHDKAVAAGYVKDNIKDVYRKLYHGPSNSYLNFIILLFAIGKIPDWLLSVLLNKKIVQKDITIPGKIFQLFLLIGFARRGIDFLLKGDPYTFFRLVKYNPLAP